MVAAARREQEREEVDALLASGLFDRAPNLELLLRYICGKYFEGEASAIKEYNLAVEALGRPADFDQKRDSIVRVEIHRLRKRLREYYETEGANRELRLEIPTGQYVPRFIERPPTPPAAPNTQTVPIRRSTHAWVALGIVLAAAAAVAVLFARAGLSIAAPPSLGKASIPAPASEIRILAGSSRSYVDRFGRTWLADRYFNGGATYMAADQEIFGTENQNIYRARRDGAFSYDIPMQPGVYELRLHFAEVKYGGSNAAGGGESTRIIRVKANGNTLMEALDVIADVGARTADTRVFKDISPLDDGKIHLQFEGLTNSAFVNAIEITPGTRGRMKPIRMIAQNRVFRDAEAGLWMPERYVKGGQLVARDEAVAGATDPALYAGERFGNISYSVPVAPGRYALKLHFSERWFGPGKPGGGGAGQRLFDILCNGVALARNFDIYKVAGGSDRALVATFHNLQPTAQGRLEIALVPRRNYASINAIEIIDESQ